MTWRNWRPQTAVGAGFVLSAFFLWLALRNVDVASLGEAFAAMSYMPVAMCAGALSIGIVLRGVRWRVIAGFPREQQRNFFRATNLGVLTNQLFPGRGGEFVRVITLARLSHSSLPGPLASALIDRLVDVSVLLACASMLYWIFPVGGLLGTWLAVVLGIGCLITLLVVLYSRSSGFGEALISRLAARWLQRWPLRPEVFLAELRGEFRRLLGSWLSIELVVLAALILCADYGVIAALIHAFDLSLPVEAPLVLWVFLAAGSALPSAPGYVGVYQVAAVWALSLFFVSAPTAIAIATVLQITTLAVALVMAGPGVAVAFKRFLLGRSRSNDMVG
ncbi:MAG: flippase-like domain-containing protein [Gammaproteobacteria bacterium]|nr:flippase-like domain-containing protein [Gammaproteobacteria bacterium]MBU1647643.1 flippase-like domain-containing protein [Gammaproteobacteria bacterium]MBU1971530.1 flippase-like domain-containing protein [Gammaproteobacteria bacterium]